MDIDLLQLGKQAWCVTLWWGSQLYWVSAGQGMNINLYQPYQPYQPYLGPLPNPHLPASCALSAKKAVAAHR